MYLIKNTSAFYPPGKGQVNPDMSLTNVEKRTCTAQRYDGNSNNSFLQDSFFCKIFTMHGFPFERIHSKEERLDLISVNLKYS